MTQFSNMVRFGMLVAVLVLLGFPATVQAQNGSLKVTSFPVGANVSVEGVDSGKVTPMTINLAVGTHTVVVSIPNSGRLGRLMARFLDDSRGRRIGHE